MMNIEARRNSVCRQCATAGEEDVSNTAIGAELSARIVDPFPDEVVNAADYGCAAAPGAAAHPDPPERAMGRRWLAVAATALVTAYVALVVVPAAETSPAPIAGIAPSYGPKNGQPGAQCGGDHTAHLGAGTRCRLRPTGARG